MSAITKVDAANILNVLMLDRINAGISWGTNAYPAGSDPTWFNLTNAGQVERFDPNFFTDGWTSVSAQNAMNSVSYFISFLCAIRLTRIVIYLSGNGAASPGNSNDWTAWTRVQSDQTAVATLNAGTVPNVMVKDVGNQQASAPLITPGTPTKYSDYSEFCTRMVNRFLTLTRNSGAFLLTKTICHSSCHSNCHGSRNRR